MKKAIGYISEIQLGYSNCIISCEEQKERIEDFCKRENIILTNIVKEISPENDLFERPGIQYLLKNLNDIDCVIVERPWCIGRKGSVLESFMKKLEEKNVGLICATKLWDCASQFVRRFYRDKKGESIEDEKNLNFDTAKVG